MEDWERIELDEDEADHLRAAPDEVTQHIGLANAAAVLVLNGIGGAAGPVAFNTAEGIAGLLLAKAAQNIRFACIGLRIGYYSGAGAVIRSAVEALAYAALFNREPEQLAQWYRNEFSSSDKLDADRKAQFQAAKRALLTREIDPIAIRSATQDFWNTANKSIHATVLGLADEFGVDIAYFVPDDLGEAFEKSGDDFERALETYVLMTKYPRKPRPEAPPDAEDNAEVFLQLYCHMDPAALDNLSTFAFYVAHRLLDETSDTVKGLDREFIRGYREWHREVRRA